ncbi:hypothetical protein [Psychrobacter sp. 72-O-c]|uniref:hypothetical protein n=1 Tax=Psychrobacter sp. 72-O-c TaxID=2774125 RepID=UPI00191B7F53|nr:hypothetical protein [Psychrobacter sp. 72-O-c]
MKDSFEIFPQPLHVSGEGQRRCCLIKERTASGDTIEKELWFLYPAGLPMLEDDNSDSYLLAVLLPAMQLKANITVHGSASSELLANLTELQYVWQKWCPEQYFLIDIKVDHIRKNECRVDGAVCAFSGGADAQFTAYRHATGQAGYSSQALHAGVLVHGFDIPLSDTKGFAGAEKLASKVLDDLGLRLITVRTNTSELWGVNWEHYSGTALAAVLCGLSRYAGAGLIASGDAYDELFTPWGSHPITDPLFSSGIFKVIHDGAGFRRSEKIKTISQWPVGVNSLRVCWEGSENDRNCGSCEKCVRTRLNFLIAGVLNPTCFSTPLKKAHFKKLKLNRGYVTDDWKYIREKMISADVDAKWVRQVEKVIKRKPGPQLAYLFPPGTQRRVFVKNLMKKYLK